MGDIWRLRDSRREEPRVQGTCGKIIIDFVAFQIPKERVDLVGHGTGKRHYYRTFKISAAKGARGDLA